MQSMNIHLEPTSMHNTNDNEEMSPSDSLVKPEEVGIILVVLAIWVWACLLFYIRWVTAIVWLWFKHPFYSRCSKFSRLEPYNPYYATRVRLDSVVSLMSDKEVLGSLYSAPPLSISRRFSQNIVHHQPVRRQSTFTCIRKKHSESRLSIFLPGRRTCLSMMTDTRRACAMLPMGGSAAMDYYTRYNCKAITGNARKGKMIQLPPQTE